MNAYAYSPALEFREEHELRKKGWLGSVTLHGALLAMLFLWPHIASTEAPLTEFTWVEAGSAVEPVETPAPPVQAAAEQPKIEETPTPQPTGGG